MGGEGDVNREARGYLSLFAVGCAILGLLQLHWHDGMAGAAWWGFALGVNAVFALKWLEYRE
jgi:hypothetical protein